MHSRSDDIDDFLARTGWSGATRTMLAGDASFRRYERIFLDGRQAVLMDAPPQKEDIRPFIAAAEMLAACGLSAPSIFASDLTNGFLLLEDLGDDLFTPLLRQSAGQEETLYLAATDVLVELYRLAQVKDFTAFPAYSPLLLLHECALFADWYLPAMMGAEAAAPLARDYKALWQELMEKLPALHPVFVLRDYHADNLLWLPEREAIKRVGLLDFQDAVIGSPAYDMVSFLEDARRDVNVAARDRVLSYYLESTRIAEADFRASYALLGAQRNCKIIGIFTRLAVRDGKRHYLSYLPRVWRHLEHDLQHPLLASLRQWMDRHIMPVLRGGLILEGIK